MNAATIAWPVKPTTHTTGLTESLGMAQAFQGSLPTDPDRSFHSSLRLFEVLLSYGRAKDPRVILQAVNAYINANQQAQGIALFQGLLDEFGPTYDPETRAIYMASLALLRATHADRVPLIQRIGWVLKTFALLEGALALTGHQEPVTRWAAGIVYAQVPAFFRKKKDAYKHLTWLAEHPETEPAYGFYREAYHHLALLYRADGQAEKARHYLRRSGFENYAPKSLLMGWLTAGPQGSAMTPEPILNEVVPGRVFALFGFGFSDIYFVLSDDGRELIAIDAGTHPHTLQAAHEFLLARHPHLPQVTTALITHAHWDHIGGHGYLRAQNPDLKTYGSDKFGAVVDRVLRNHSYTYFRGTSFDHAWIEAYKPTHPVADAQTITVGGTQISLIPVTGGETEDSVIIHMPGLKTVFVGDIVMPFYGEPWVNEGEVEGVISALHAVISCDATHVLHGHHPLTMLYGPENLKTFSVVHQWLVKTVQHHVANGYSAKDVVRLNLIPPEIVNFPELYLGYAAARDTLIARTAKTMTGIWSEDHTGQSPEGLDVITAVEHGRMLEKYLGLTAAKSASVLRRMIANGDNELALQFAVAAEHRFGATPAIIAAKEDAADRLRGNAQYIDPFKFTTYSEIIGHPQMPIAPEVAVR